MQGQGIHQHQDDPPDVTGEVDDEPGRERQRTQRPGTQGLADGCGEVKDRAARVSGVDELRAQVQPGQAEGSKVRQDLWGNVAHEVRI